MSMSSTVHAVEFLFRLAAGAGDAVTPKTIPIADIACDWYEPARPRRTVVVALHGVTLNGKDDRRLRAFAGALARTGTTCVVPNLPGLSDLRWDPQDIATIGRVLSAVAGRTTARVVLAGFSHGASLALVAAAHPESSRHVAHVLGFGAYHSLARVIARLAATAEPSRPGGWGDYVYAHLVQAHRHGAALALSPSVRSSADDLLRRYDDAATLEEKRRFFEAHLRHLDLLRYDRASHDPSTLAAMSPKGQLAGLACAVGLVHDPDDRVVPVSEACALLAELRGTREGGRHRLLVTRLTPRATVAGVLRPSDALRLVQMTAPLVGS